MSEIRIENESRRRFLRAGVGLTLGIYFFPSAALAAVKATPAPRSAFEPNAFVRIGTDNTVTVIVKHLEMGQGTYTGLPTLVAEELDAAWDQIRAEGAPADAKRYNNLLFGASQGTGGSTAIANSYEQMRRAGATARAMLVTAAAQRWGVAPESITVSQGVVTHRASGRRATFGELAKAASRLPVPANVTLKDPKDFVYIGKHVPRTDNKPKINGSAQYTQDIRLPGMLVAVVAHPPRFGARIKWFDASRAKAIKGVADVVAIPSGVAVLAPDFWTAKKGRDALSVEWDEASAFNLGTPELFAQYRDLANTLGAVVALTHDPKLDDLALIEALRSSAFYVDYLGSQRSASTRKARLHQYFELTDAELDRLHAPVGLPIGSHTPPEIALSIMAEITAVKNGAGPLRERNANNTRHTSASVSCV